MSTALSIPELLEQHPWPEDYAAEWKAGKAIERLWVYELPAPPSVVWPIISDTSRLNRTLGLAEMTFWEKDGKRYGAAKPGGVQHEWMEVPWNWVAEQWLTSVRIYSRGFMRVAYSIQKLEAIEGGCRMYAYFGVLPRSMMSSLAVKLGFPQVKKAYDRVIPQLAKQLGAARPEILQLAPPPLPDDAAARLVAGKKALLAEGLPAACVDKLVEWIETGDDADLHRIQIRERARVWNVDETDMLRTALHATRAGLLDLSWDTICPHCRGVRDENPKLSDLRADAHCGPCGVDFTTDKPEAVEVTFRVHPSIREVPEQLYCSAEPAKREHVRVQREMPPGGKIHLQPRLAPGRYGVAVGNSAFWYLDVEEGGAQSLTWDSPPAGAVIKAAPEPTVDIANAASTAEMFRIMRATWSDHALRPGMLLSFQEFRDLFSEEYLGADVKLAVGEQTLLFTDVVGSTAFYASRGDPGAFVEIKRHFDEVFAIVGKNRGAVVKTIGDAVMATFVNPVDAVRASQQIHTAFSPDRADTPIRLRISLNTGPCIAVRLNANADFFGGTVNIAAKLQALAESYQIAMSEVTYRSPGVAEFLAEQGVKLEELEYSSKALREIVKVRRWSVFSESAPRVAASAP